VRGLCRLDHLVRTVVEHEHSAALPAARLISQKT
jgi:hypothetical protein